MLRQQVPWRRYQLRFAEEHKIKAVEKLMGFVQSCGASICQAAHIPDNRGSHSMAGNPLRLLLDRSSAADGFCIAGWWRGAGA